MTTLTKRNLLERFAMRKSCGDCAFVPGSAAHGCEVTRLTATLCVTAGEPFYCHRAKDGEVVGPRLDHQGEPVLCHGFVQAMQSRGPHVEWEAAVAVELLEIMEEERLRAAVRRAGGAIMTRGGGRS